MRRAVPTLFLGAAVAGLAGAAGAWDTNDWQFLESIEKANLRFFQEQKRGPYMLLNDVADYDSYNWTNLSAQASSVAGIGFELTAVCLGHYRGWISYSNAYEQVLRTLRGFNGLLSPDTNVFHRVNGWTHHMYWIDTEKAGQRYEGIDELSVLDHSFFIGGCIFVSEYFKGTEAGDLASNLYAQTTWSWRPNNDYNFGYSENLLSIVESAEAPAFKKGAEAYNMWRDYCIPPWPRTLQLYFWQYPHSWVDFRFRTDTQRGDNHAIVAQQSIEYQRQCAIDLHNGDPAKYDMIGTNCWGWTAATPSDWYRQMAPWLILGSNDVEWCSDSGSITPFALPGCMVYAPVQTMAALKYIFEEFYVKGWDLAKGERAVWSPVYGFLNCFNKGRPWAYYSNPAQSNWFHPVNAGIDYGPNVLLLENHKMGTTWRWFMQNPSIATGMYTVGFGAPVHVTRATFSNQVNEFGMSFGHWQSGGGTSETYWVTTSITNDYVRDYAVRIMATGPNCGGWVDLNSSDQRAQAQVSFWIKAGTGQEQVNVGLKDVPGQENKVRLADYTGGSTPTNWTEVKIPLERFCLTGDVTNDVWPGNLALLSFTFTNGGGGSLDIDYVAFTKDTIAPARPTNSFGAAQAGDHARLVWEPTNTERDVVGYHVWRRLDSTSGFTRITARLVPTYKGFFEDTSMVARAGQEVRYAIQPQDNSEPPNSGPFALEQKTTGGRLDVDWNNGRNPNVLGGVTDSYWGASLPQSFTFVYTNGPEGRQEWVRRSWVTSVSSGHYIDTANADVRNYAALSFWIRGASGGEQMDLGLRDDSDHETRLDLDYLLAGRSVATPWGRVVVPLSEFTNVNLGALRSISFGHEAEGEVQIAEVAFLVGQRASLVSPYFTEAEDFTRQSGSPTSDYKAAASGGQVLGQSWGADNEDYADYEFGVAHPLTSAVLHVRYACSSGNGRAFDVRWDEQYRATLTCTNTGGWGDSSNQLGWATASLGSLTSGPHKLTFYANGADDPVNLDCWYLSADGSYFRECEEYDTQTGSQGQDLKAGASRGEVLGGSWGVATNSEAVYYNVDAGVQTAAWLHVWYACGVSSGRVVDAYVDGERRARLLCAGTPGWGNQVADFGHVAAAIGFLGTGSHTVRFAVPGPGDGINLDCFYLGPEGIEDLGADTDGDGLGDRQERTAGTSKTSVDTDGDGLSDGDEVQFGRYGQVSDPTKADTDSDGLDDREEGIAGTDPWSTASAFLLDGCWNGTNGGVVIEWAVRSGRLYRLYTCGGISNNAGFQEVPDPENILVEGGTARYRDTVFTNMRTYRIDVRRNP